MVETTGTSTKELQQDFFAAINALQSRGHKIEGMVDKVVWAEARARNENKRNTDYNENRPPDAQTGDTRREEKQWNYIKNQFSQSFQNLEPEKRDYIREAMRHDSTSNSNAAYQEIDTTPSANYNKTKSTRELLKDAMSGLKLVPQLEAITSITINNKTFGVPRYSERSRDSWQKLEKSLAEALEKAPTPAAKIKSDGAKHTPSQHKHPFTLT